MTSDTNLKSVGEAKVVEHVLFPTLVVETFNEEHEALKKIFENKIFDYTDDDGFSSEMTGHLTMHHEEAFRPVFEMASRSARTYIKRMNIDPDLYQFNLVKSWMNIVRERPTPMHAHRDAHLSFVYYLNIPKDADTSIMFEREGNRHEPFPGCIKFAPPSVWTWLNSYSWSLVPREGLMFTFPSSLVHGTLARSDKGDKGFFSIKDYRRHRVAIAGDFLLTYKDKQAKPLGLQPVENWRTF
jgi:hypothetical protein